jgi:hypothetical protein
MKLLEKLPPFGRKSGKRNVVIDTPKGCRNKYAFDFKHRAYVLKTMLPRGATFPFDFGSIPGTEADDGDPLAPRQETKMKGLIAARRLIRLRVPLLPLSCKQ